MSPIELENLIEVWRTVGTLEPDRDRAQYAFARMGELVAQRSPERVAEMESRLPEPWRS